MLSLRTFAVLAIVAGSSAAQAPQPPAQTPPSFLGPCSNLSCEIQNDWTRNNVLLSLLAGAMPEDKYGFKPTKEEQSFGERVLHVADVNVSMLQGLGGKTAPPVIDP